MTPDLSTGARHTMSFDWGDRLVTPEQALARISPGMSIYLSTGPAEPRILVQSLVASRAGNLRDLDLIQLVSLGDALSIEAEDARSYRLKTFFSGYLAGEAIAEGRVDLIPANLSAIPDLFCTGAVRVDAAFVQIGPPDAAGYSSLGLAVDAARPAMEQAELVVGEINARVPRTLGDSLVHESEFDLVVESSEEPFRIGRWQVDEVMDRVARNVATLIEGGTCLTYSIGPLFEALTPHLATKRDLGVHSPMLTDSLMDLIRSGAVTNRRKASFRGKSVASWVLGSAELASWAHENPLLEFQGLDVTTDARLLGENEHFVPILQARKVDLTGRFALHFGKGMVPAGPGETYDLLLGARLSRGGRTIVALPSRNLAGASNVMCSIGAYANQVPNRGMHDLVVTEWGVAYLKGRTVRERAQALIDIAHPEDREELLRQAKEAHLVYADQIFVPSGRLYPEDVATTRSFGDLEVRFRAIKPSDEEGMRNLFYRFSDRSVYYRYFSPIKTMPHGKMQSYVNVDYADTMSLVAVIGEPGEDHIIGEARYVRFQGAGLELQGYADIAFVVDEAYHGRGIASFLFLHLMQIAKERGLDGLAATVLATNRAVLRVLEHSPHPIRAVVEGGLYEFTIPFAEQAPAGGSKIHYSRPGSTT